MTDYKSDPQFQELHKTVAELLSRNLGEADLEGQGDPMGEVLSGLKLLVEADVLRRLPALRFQEILTSAVSTQWYDNILNSLAELLLVVGRTGIIQSANHAATLMLGLTKDELMGRNIEEFLSSDTVNLEVMSSADVESDESRNAARHFLLAEGGGRIPVSFSSSRIFDDDGHLRAIACVMRDIRTRLKTEEDLRRSEERYMLACRGANDGLWEWDGRSRKTFYSHRFCELLGYKEQELDPSIELISGLVHEDDQEELSRAIEEHRPDESPFDVECRIKTAGAGYRYFNLRGLGLHDGQDGASRLVGSIRDITERKQNEELRTRFLEQVISAEEAERRRIARELHDETSQSLTSLKVALRAVEAALPTEELRTRLEEIRKLAGGTLEEVGRLARGLHPSVLDDLGFKPAVQKLTRDFSRAHELKIDIHVGYGSGGERLPLMIETTLYRILQEALTNVVKHAKASTISIVVERRATKVSMIIEDDGTGFDVEAMALNRGVTESGGLGLHGMRERASLLKGDLTIESTKSGGTSLYVSIPLP
jgi:PAS domain S-box-containing protein